MILGIKSDKLKTNKMKDHLGEAFKNFFLHLSLARGGQRGISSPKNAFKVQLIHFRPFETFLRLPL